MPKFRIGERVMVPKDEPRHKGNEYCGKAGTVQGYVEGTDERQAKVLYDFNEATMHTWEACLVSLDRDEALEQELTKALSPLFKEHAS